MSDRIETAPDFELTEAERRAWEGKTFRVIDGRLFQVVDDAPPSAYERLLARIEELEALAGPDVVRMFDGQVAARMKLLARIEALTVAGDGLADAMTGGIGVIDDCAVAECDSCSAMQEALAAWEKAKKGE